MTAAGRAVAAPVWAQTFLRTPQPPTPTLPTRNAPDAAPGPPPPDLPYAATPCRRRRTSAPHPPTPTRASAGSGNSILKLTTPISVSWTTFFDLVACLLVQVEGKCNGVDCGKLLGWTADRCYDA